MEFCFPAGPQVVLLGNRYGAYFAAAAGIYWIEFGRYDGRIGSRERWVGFGGQKTTDEDILELGGVEIRCQAGEVEMG